MWSDRSQGDRGDLGLLYYLLMKFIFSRVLVILIEEEVNAIWLVLINRECVLGFDARGFRDYRLI